MIYTMTKARSLAAATTLFGSLAGGSPAAVLLTPFDGVTGITVSSNIIEVGTPSASQGDNSWSSVEGPELAIDGLTSTKYLNFAKFNTGLLITPTIGLTQISSILLTSANDAPSRDPASYVLMGTMLNGSLTVSDYDLISSGSVPSFSARLTEQSIHVDATESYTAYLLYFPTVSDESNANSMQLSEVQFTGIAIPEPTSILLLGIGCLGFGFGRSRR